MKFRYNDTNYTVDDSAANDGYARLDDGTTLRLLPDGSASVSKKDKPKAPLATVEYIADTPSSIITQDHGDTSEDDPDATAETAPERPRPFKGLDRATLIARLSAVQDAQRDEKALREEMGTRLLQAGKRTYYALTDGSRVYGKLGKGNVPTIVTEKRGEEAAT